MFMRLAEPDAWIDAETLERDARRYTRADALAKVFLDFADDVTVPRILLHRAGLALHVHQADPGARARGRLERTVATQRADVIDELGTRGNRGGHERRIARVDRNRHARGARELLDDGQ